MSRFASTAKRSPGEPCRAPLPKAIAPQETAATRKVATEPVQATDLKGYEIPIFYCLRNGRLAKMRRA